jgi:hypothetical protein
MSVKNTLIYLGVVIYLFLSTTVATQFDIEQVGTVSSILIIVMALHNIGVQGFNKIANNYSMELFIAFIGVMIVSLKLITSDASAINHVVFFIFVPMLLSTLLQSQNLNLKQGLVKIILFFFVAECLVAFYERLFLKNIFPYDDVIGYGITEFLGFRSTAFLGHPLQNALCVSTIMGFILGSKIRLILKMSFVALGYVALLCFNARGAIVIWSILIPVYFLIVFFGAQRKELLTLPSLVFLFLMAVLIGNLISAQNFGDRLFDGELFDGSAQTRFEVFDAFSFVSDGDFWFGNSLNYLYVMNRLGAGGVENSFIVLMLNYGVIMGLLVIISYVAWIKKIIFIHDRSQILLILVSFVLVGSFNNSLASATSWIIFIVCCNSLPFFVSFNVNYTSRSPRECLLDK